VHVPHQALALQQQGLLALHAAQALVVLAQLLLAPGQLLLQALLGLGRLAVAST
jgi:hypothetical protein